MSDIAIWLAFSVAAWWLAARWYVYENGDLGLGEAVMFALVSLLGPLAFLFWVCIWITVFICNDMLPMVNDRKNKIVVMKGRNK